MFSNGCATCLAVRLSTTAARRRISHTIVRGNARTLTTLSSSSSSAAAVRCCSSVQRRRCWSPALTRRRRSAILRRKFSSSSSSSGNNNKQQQQQSFWEYWTAETEMPTRWTFKWYGEMVLICTVFAITGTSTMMLVRPAVRNVLGIQGNMMDGPWSYRICSLIVMSPIYGVLLVCVGTVFGRHVYFRRFAVKIFSRFGIPPELMDASYHHEASKTTTGATAAGKAFKKW